ncbi:MAG TPA: GDP-mannose 4,6-dehydratase [Armatimonadota bacterium]|nr:GDP-mannose 4,6-dehydratase [Armatimonadota bacterium]
MTSNESGSDSIYTPGSSTRRIRNHKSIPTIGILEWFRPGEYEQVERVLADLQTLGIKHLRTQVSWADWLAPGGEEWYSWLLPRLARNVELLPCFVYTPPSLGIAPKTSSPPRNPKAYADFLDVIITRFGDCFEWMELWNEPNNLREWDMTLDPDWNIFSEMVGGAAYWAKHRGKKTVLGGLSPIDPNWLRLMFERGVMAYIDAVGLHGFPNTYDYTWDGWELNVAKIRELLDQQDYKPGLWISEVGFSTWQHDQRRQLQEFVKAIEAQVDRVYWYSAYDLDPKLPTVDGFHLDERDYHFGLKRADGSPKLLFRLWAGGGIEAVQDTAWLGRSPRFSGIEEQPVLITGGAGFIGTNLAHRLLESGHSVLLLDNLWRPGVERNIQWLREIHGERVQIEVADVRDPFAVMRAVEGASQVFHFAAQVAVTTSLSGPIHDFEVNIRGTLNILEALRSLKSPPPLVFTSTNKVYGTLENIPLTLDGTRYTPEDRILSSSGICEEQHLDFHSPYGCSKGAADQYVLDYARVFGLQTVVFRMSCIYGPYQFGTEDQGWIAHFLIRAIEGQPITIYGDGMQVRDVLFIDDLVDAFLLAQSNMDTISGHAFNIGGGPQNTLSLVELVDLIEELNGQKPVIRHDVCRPGDQRYYCSNTGKFESMTTWSPKIGIREGVQRLYEWLLQSRGVYPTPLAVKRGAR